MAIKIYEGYSEKSGNGTYFRCEEGTHKITLIDGPIPTLDYWDESKEPKVKYSYAFDLELAKKKDYRLVWNLLIWNYDEEQLQVWSISSKKIRQNIIDLIDNGVDLNAIDITVKRTGKTINDTSYTIIPGAARKLDIKTVAAEIKESPLATRLTLTTQE